MLYIPPFLPSGFSIQDAEKTIIQRLPAEHTSQFWGAEHAHRIKSFLMNHGVEAILAQWLDASLPLVDLARELGIRYYCQVHGTDITAGLRDANVRQTYAAYNRVDAVIAPSEFGREQLLKLGILPERTRVIRHAVNVPDCLPMRDSKTIRCLAAGRMDLMKGPLLVLDGFRRAAESYPDLSLDYVGDGPMIGALKQMARAFGLDDRVKFHGFVPHERVTEMMRSSHILIHPSITVDNRFDTCPVTIAEAMASGMAVVASRHGGIPEQIVDGESGFLVDEYDTRALSARIAQLAGNPGLRNRFGCAAWNRAKAMFSRETVQEQWLHLLGLRAFTEGH